MSTPSNGAPLLTAAQVARRLNVTRGWVYHHADELGALRLGDGPRARLRFDADLIAARLHPRQRPGTAPTQARHSTVELLPIRGPRPRRTLD